MSSTPLSLPASNVKLGPWHEREIRGFGGSGPGDGGVTLEPVCGCDGVSYTSAACADQEGVRVERDGECE